MGNGIHTGVDYPAGAGTPVYAARPGTAHFTSHGSAFGNHQLEITPGDGTRDFYAHMTTRMVGDGAKVEAGQQVGKVGSEGNVTGPHLHFERHSVASGGWSCSVVRNPQPSIDYQPTAPKPPPEEDMPKFSRTRLTKSVKLKADVWTTLTWDQVSSGDAGKAGEAYINIGPSAYSGTLLLRATVPNGRVDPHPVL
jgi:murein DD-endopeptidase MepM/ murein hydrolase activator NlpD